MPDNPLVLVNGPVFTADPALPWARAVAVGEGRVVAVGTERDALDAVGPGAKVVDLAGRMALPGFQDAHVHPLHGGLAMIRCDLLPCDRWDEAAEAIRARVAGLADGEWLRGRGWAFEWFDGFPSAALLDEVAGDRPAYLVVRDGHSGWASSAALAAAGIGVDTPDPPDGRIERLADGSPQGTLHEGAMRLVEEAMPPDTPAELDAALDAGQAHLLSLGITAWQDAWVTDAYHAAYRRAADDGRLRAQVRGALWWDRSRGLTQVDELAARAREGTGPYRPGTVKLMLDGVCENLTASMLEPYRGHDTTGIDFIDPAELGRIVTALDAAGLQCHFHAIGDAAVRSGLDAVEAARGRNGWTDLRHTIAHLQVVHPDDIPRFHRLGVVANCQPLWACNDPAMTELTLPLLGEDRARWQYPFGTLAGAGATLAIGSDWPVSSADPMPQASVATSRLPVDDPGAEPFLTEERLPLGAVLTAFTAGSSHVNHLAPSRGVIRPGNVADLAVLELDPFTVEQVAGIRVDLTILGGRVVHERTGR